MIACLTCGREFESMPAVWGHQKAHTKAIRHGSVAGYLAEARRSNAVRHEVGGTAARKKAKHCKACRDAWNTYYRFYKAQQAITKAQQHLADLQRVNAGLKKAYYKGQNK